VCGKDGLLVAEVEKTTPLVEQAQACAGNDSSDADVLRGWFRLYSGMQNVTNALLTEVERNGGLTPPEFHVLWHLRESAEQSAPMNEVSRLLNFSTAGTTKLVDRLCAMDLVERRTSPADRRVILAKLTTAGLRLADRAATLLAHALRDRMIGRLGEDRFVSLIEAFDVIGEESSPC